MMLVSLLLLPSLCELPKAARGTSPQEGQTVQMESSFGQRSRGPQVPLVLFNSRPQSQGTAGASTLPKTVHPIRPSTQQGQRQTLQQQLRAAVGRCENVSSGFPARASIPVPRPSCEEEADDRQSPVAAIHLPLRSIDSSSSSFAAVSSRDAAILAERERHRIEYDQAWKRFQLSQQQLKAEVEQHRITRGRIGKVVSKLIDAEERCDRLQIECDYQQESNNTRIAQLSLENKWWRQTWGGHKCPPAPPPLRDSDVLRVLRSTELMNAAMKECLMANGLWTTEFIRMEDGIESSANARMMSATSSVRHDTNSSYTQIRPQTQPGGRRSLNHQTHL